MVDYIKQARADDALVQQEDRVDFDDADFQPIFTVTSNIQDVEVTWRALEKFGLQSPGQSFDFVKVWVCARGISLKRQFYVTAYVGKRPVALMPLLLTKRLGVSVLTWFLGDHVACNGVLLNQEIFSKLTDVQRQEFWHGLLQAVPLSDALYLPGIPTGDNIEFEAFEGFGSTPVCDYVYRAKATSWAALDGERRDRKRRRRDKQHRQKLDALGAVHLERIEDKAQATPIIHEMFEQKRKRFELLGIEDPFVKAEVRQSYIDAFDATGDARPLLYVLFLNGEVVGVRYCVQHQARLFMLISSMSDDEKIMAGSPGHQCLLETFKIAFDRHDVKEIDLGVGESDEKRRWCNRLQPVCNRFIPRTPIGWAFMVAQASLERLKYVVKSNKLLFGFYKAIRGFLPPIFRT